MNLTLRIKKYYFNEILQQRKTIEFRSDTEFYRRKFINNKYKTLTLHYQKSSRLVVEIKDIKLKIKPKYLANSPYVTTNKCWFIYLGKIIKEVT